MGVIASRVLLRRPVVDTRLRCGPLDIDEDGRIARLNETILDLTPKEFDLLATFVAHPGHAFRRVDLMRSVWHTEPAWQNVGVVTEYVHRLRAKIELDMHHPLLIATVRGIGYRLDAPAAVASGTDTWTYVHDHRAIRSTPFRRPARNILIVASAV